MTARCTAILLALALAAGPAAAACTVPDQVLHAFGDKPVSHVQERFARLYPECTLVLNGEISGAFGFWKKPPQPSNYRWPAGTVVATAGTGRQGEYGHVDLVPRIFMLVQATCAPNEAACAIPLSQQWPAPVR